MEIPKTLTKFKVLTRIEGTGNEAIGISIKLPHDPNMDSTLYPDTISMNTFGYVGYNDKDTYAKG